MAASLGPDRFMVMMIGLLFSTLIAGTRVVRLAPTIRVDDPRGH